MGVVVYRCSSLPSSWTFDLSQLGVRTIQASLNDADMCFTSSDGKVSSSLPRGVSVVSLDIRQWEEKAVAAFLKDFLGKNLVLIWTNADAAV